MLYAHAVIEVGDTVYQRGDAVPDDVEGLGDLIESGAVKYAEYDPADEPTQVPDFVEIDGVRYIKTGEGAGSKEDSDAG